MAYPLVYELDYDEVVKKYYKLLKALQPNCDNCEDDQASSVLPQSEPPESPNALANLTGSSSTEEVMLRLRYDSQSGTSTTIKSGKEDGQQITNEELRIQSYDKIKTTKENQNDKCDKTISEPHNMVMLYFNPIIFIDMYLGIILRRLVSCTLNCIKAYFII